MKRTREALVAEAARLRRKEVARALERQQDLDAERKMRESIAANVKDRIDHLDAEQLKNYRNEHDRIMADMKGMDPNSSGHVRMRMRADQLEKLAEMTLNKRPHPVFRQVKGSFKVLGGTPQDVKYEAPEPVQEDLKAALKDALGQEEELKDLSKPLQRVLDKLYRTRVGEAGGAILSAARLDKELEDAADELRTRKAQKEALNELRKRLGERKAKRTLEKRLAPLTDKLRQQEVFEYGR